MKIHNLDHMVITANNLEKTIEFYTSVLGMELQTFSDERKALILTRQKINLHKRGKALKPQAQNPLPGSADLCFITNTPIPQVISHLTTCNISIIEGQVEKTGATGSLFSIYIRDPDGNLVEIAIEIKA